MFQVVYGINQGGTISLGSEADNVNPNVSYASISGRRVSSLGYQYGGYLTLNVSDGTTLNERLRVTSGGNVGIGTNTVTRGPLHIHQPSTSDCQIHLTNNNTGTTSSDGLTIFTGQSNGDCGFVSRESGGSIEFYTNNSGSVAQRLRITSSGNIIPGTNNATSIGNGTTNFASIWASTRFRGNDNVKLVLGDAQDLVIRHDGTNNIIGSPVGGDLHIKSGTGDNDNQLIAAFKHSNASVGIGITNPQAQLHVAGRIHQTVIEYPTIRPTLDLNFAATKVLDDRITFTRDGVGTYIDENGILKYASNNTPRFDHDPVTGESLGLLIEESKTNILYGTPSQSNTVNSYNQYNSLTGKYDATKLAKNSSTNTQSHGSWNWNGNLSTTSFVMSVFVKKINHTSFFLQLVSSGVGDNLYVYYNIDTGVTSHTDYSSPGNLTVTKSIENYPDGWFRLVARVEGFSNAALHSGFRCGFAHPTNNSQQYVDSSDEVLVYGAQAEVGDFATSYIPTHESTTSVTRGADIAIIKGTNFSSWYNASESTIFFESGVAPTTNSKYFTFHGSDGGGTELIE